MNSEISWDDLFEFQKEYRRTKNITGTAFLRHLKLPGTQLPYLYSNLREPSIKPSSIGGKLRVAIRDLQVNPQSPFECNTLNDYLHEYFIQHETDFKARGVFAIYTSQETGELVVHSEKDIEIKKAKELFADFKIDGMPDMNELIDQLRVDVYFPAAKYSAPVVVRSGLLEGNLLCGYGTMTPILCHFGLFGVTARHCLLPPGSSIESLNAAEEIDVFSYHETSTITSRQKTESKQKIGVFTKACLSITNDIAVVMLSELHAYNVNEIIKGVNIRFGGEEETKSVISQKVKVMKVGISTLVTAGEVCEEISEGDFVVRSIECSSFASGGDSGALIISSEESSFGLVLGIITHTNKQGRANCLNIFAMYEIDLIRNC